jgi:CMP-N,N'-diacetyllegionaminic acid synthase
VNRLDVVGLVTARGGSKRLPRKSVLPLAGKPMIAWTIDAACDSAALARVIVSTDDDEIAGIARAHGADVPFVRPTELGLDDSDHVAVVEHALDWLVEHEGVEPDYVMLLQPTSPLRTAEDIDACVSLARDTGAAAVVSVTAMKPQPDLALRVSADGTLEHAFPDLDRGGEPLVAPNGAVYLNRVASLRADRAFIPNGARGYLMPSERSLDVDTQWDFTLAEAALQGRPS